MTRNRCRLLLLLAITAWQGTFARAVEYVTIVDNGPSSNRIDMAFLGDGYTTSQIATDYASHVQSTLDHFFDGNEDPFPRYKNFFNAYRVNVISNESGADRPPEGIYRDTALDASYYFGGPKEKLYINNYKANDAITESGLTTPQFSIEMKLVTVNDTIYGGGGGVYAVFAGGNSSAWEISMHELGHSFSGLADEYVYAGYNLTYNGAEPIAANITASPTGDKWSHWEGYTDPDHPEMGAIQAYEGAAGYYAHGLFRPSQNSKMKSLDRPFDAVSREKIILDIYDHVAPLDGALDSAELLVDPASLWVDVVDPEVIKVEWYVDNQLVVGATGETFDPLSLGPGEYEITARAYDDTPWVRTDLSKLEQRVDWSVTVTPIPEPATDFDGDGNVDVADVNALTAVGNLVVGVPVSQTDAKFDLTVDGIVDSTDLDKWLADAATINGYDSPYLKGDTNLNGEVDVWKPDGTGDAEVLSSDLNTMSGMVWGDGDFNGDGDVDVWETSGLGDAQLLSTNMLATNDVGVTTVPEPSTLILLSMGVVGLLTYGWRRRILRSG